MILLCDFYQLAVNLPHQMKVGAFVASLTGNNMHLAKTLIK